MKKDKYSIIIYVLVVIIVGVSLYFFLYDNKKEVTSISLKSNSVDVFVDHDKKIEVSVLPSNAKDKTLLWTSSNEDVVSVTNDGVIIGKSAGDAIITIRTKDGKVSTSFAVKVINEEATTLELKEKEIEIKVSDTKELDFVIEPEKLRDLVTWESDNETVASIDEKGILSGNAPGEAIIKVRYGDKEDICNVIVESLYTPTPVPTPEIVAVKDITLDKKEITIDKGKTTTLKATIEPSNATNKNITWSSSNSKVAKVDVNGKVTAIGVGKATITATLEGKKATSEIISIGYYITKDKKHSNYSKVASYNSETLKYKVLRKGIDEYVLVWVLDANKQWNSALPKLGTRYKPDEILSKEIKKYGYEKKGLIATNGSAFYDGWGDYPTTPFLLNKGKIIRDIKNITYKKSYGNVGITKGGILKKYDSFTTNDYAKNKKKKQKMLDDGVRNNFTIFNPMVKSDGWILNSNIRITLTALCQVDANNFVIYSGYTKTLKEVAILFRDTFKCKKAFRFDGGTQSANNPRAEGSRALYYKTGSMSSAKKVHAGRELPDMMYFVE